MFFDFIWLYKVRKFCILLCCVRKCYHICAENGSNFRTQYKTQKYTKLANLQGYIFRILQHFATKPCNFTHFSMLFLAMDCGDLFASPCLDQNLVYNGNCLLTNVHDYYLLSVSIHYYPYFPALRNLSHCDKNLGKFCSIPGVETREILSYKVF